MDLPLLFRVGAFGPFYPMGHEGRPFIHPGAAYCNMLNNARHPERRLAEPQSKDLDRQFLAPSTSFAFSLLRSG
jgi:hypothetical protein